MNIEKLSVAAIRSTVIDMTSKANSGHPGMALGSAPFLYVLFNKYLNINCQEEKWDNRDRFILASGHASPLLYTLLHLSGYNITTSDLANFRQLNSLTPGHPEINHTSGVDATSGPLGQGVAQAVGMALAEKILSEKFNKSEYKIVNHYTYALCGDGDIEEGITQEAISLAGLWNLNKLVLIYDSNRVTLDGDADLSISDNTALRFKAMNWNVIDVADGNDLESIDKALKKARKSEKPTLIINHTIIGYGSMFEGTSKVHGSPLTKEDGLAAKKKYDYQYGEFEIPSEVYQHFKQNTINRGNKEYRKWKKLISRYNILYRDLSNDYSDSMNMKLSLNIDNWPSYEVGFKQASRNTSQTILNLIAEENGNLIGGSADVAASVMTKLKNYSIFSATNILGRNFQFGVREFAMASIQNGILLHKGLRTFVGSFLVFSDYLKPAIRMASLQNLPAIYLFSHDSIAVGEDGPTHQPVEQLAMLRSIPNINIYRPCDANEVVYAYRHILEESAKPTAIILSRQNLTVNNNIKYEDYKKGAYIYSPSLSETTDATIIATGSEVGLAVETQKYLYENFQYSLEVVSISSMELLRKLSKEEKNAIIRSKKVVALEMLSSFGWHEFAEAVISISDFGKSGKLEDVINDFGFTKKEVARKIVEFIKKK